MPKFRKMQIWWNLTQKFGYNANVSIKRFVRFETGEGLEKKNEDFAAEVAAQMGQ